MQQALTCIEICAGAGGQALGLEQAGFEPVVLVENDSQACATLRLNRPAWNVLPQDVRAFHAFAFKGVDLLAGGVPCPPFSKAGRQLGQDDERDLFPEALRLVEECQPRAVMLENVRGLLDPVFEGYREQINLRLRSLGYSPSWRMLQAADFGVPQLRPRVVMIAIEDDAAPFFRWPSGTATHVSVGEALRDEMAANGWEGASEWAQRANTVAPTLVGGSKKHGGPDLGPTRARKAWATLGVDGKTVAEAPPAAGHTGLPRLTVSMAARVQGFPSEWKISGRKTAAYRQVGNAFPPPVAEAVARSIRMALESFDASGALHSEERLWRPVTVREPSYASI